MKLNFCWTLVNNPVITKQQQQSSGADGSEGEVDEDEDDEDEETDDELDDSEDEEEEEEAEEDTTDVKTQIPRSKAHPEDGHKPGSDSGHKTRHNRERIMGSNISSDKHSQQRVSCPDLNVTHLPEPSKPLVTVTQIDAVSTDVPTPSTTMVAPVVDLTKNVHSSHPLVSKGTSNTTTLDQQVATNTSTITTTNAQIDTHAPSEHTMAALRRQRPVIHKLYTFQSRTEQPQQLRATIVAPVTANEPVKPNVLRTGIHGVYPNHRNFYVPPTGLQGVRTNPPIGPPLPSTGMGPSHDIRTTSAPQTTIVGQPTTQASEPPVYAGSVIGGSGLASFFTSQMSAFKVWLQTTDEKRPPAMQLPILLQILLSQSHRTRAMQLLSEFLDLGPWAVTHCLMVGILPYIVRLFSSNLFEVKPHLVFIWGKIIASAQLLTRTITAFALTKMLEKEPNGEPDSFFQEVSLKQNFIPLVLSQLADNPPDLEQETLVRLRLWLIFALSKLHCVQFSCPKRVFLCHSSLLTLQLWRKNDEARWFGIRYNVTEVLYAYLDDICPEVRAATVCALGTLVDNQTLDASKQDHASQIGLQVCTHLVKLATLEASPLVRRELIAALCGLVRQFETQLCAVAFCYLLELQQALQNPPNQTPSRTPASRQSRHSVTGTFCGTSNRPTPDGWSSVNRSAHNRENGLVESHLLRTPTTTSSAVLSPKFLKRPDYFNPAHTVFASSLHHVLHLFVLCFFSRLFTCSGTTNVYFLFWLALVHLSNDPYPDVAKAARVVVRYLLDKVDIPTIASSSSSSNETATELNVCQAGSPQRANSTSVVTFGSPTDPPPTSTAFRIPEIVVPNTPLARAVRPQMASPPRASIQLIPGSGPAPSQTSGSPRGSQPQVMYQSFSSCSPMNACSYLTQRRPARPGVALTSTFLIHSAQFPGRRHQQADQVIRKPLLDAQTMPPPLVRTPVVSGDNDGSDNSQSVLTEVQRTQFFAWSCRWFTRPLLVKYGGTSMKETRSPVTHSSNTTSSSPADTIFQKPSFSFGLSDKSPHPSHRSTSPDPELAALCAVSVDSDAVAYADRLSRLTNLRHTLRSGRLRWLEALSGNHVRTQARSSSDLLPTDDTVQARLMSQLACHQLDNEPGPIRVHPYQPHLVVGDRSGVSVQSSRTLESLNRLPTTPDLDLFSSFSDQSQPVHYSQSGSSRVTDLQFINCCEERCLLLCAHEDGRVRVWRNYLRDLGQDPEIVTAWTGLSELIPSSQPAGLVAHWSQSTSQLALGGDSRLIRLWDCEREARLRDVPTGADACVTGLDRTADQRLLCAGFGDGGVRVFDLRAPASSTTASAQHGDCHIFSGQADTGWIHGVQFGVGGRLYATGSTGTVSTWQWTDTSSSSTQQPSRVSRRTTLATTKLTSRTPTTGLSTSITAATATGSGARFERRLYPARIAIPANAAVHCAALKVKLMALCINLLSLTFSFFSLTASHSRRFQRQISPAYQHRTLARITRVTFYRSVVFVNYVYTIFGDSLKK
ncbi:regulatory associated protein of mTOR [Paragonimus westermani]|uniref:Regulatory associated protein of mTOR n=1 Tax=Paragonimus westermani TaxID=34504 RepID=A0A5J4NCM5_9TREM|nr:regulatory associated protein of mTOR [Paragonimus westermani]